MLHFHIHDEIDIFHRTKKKNDVQFGQSKKIWKKKKKKKKKNTFEPFLTVVFKTQNGYDAPSQTCWKFLSNKKIRLTC